MARPTTISTCRRVYDIMTSETAKVLADGRFGWTVDWTHPTTWGRFALVTLHLLFIVSMAPALSLAMANFVSEMGWVTGMLPRSAIAIAIAAVLVISLNRSVGANSRPWRDPQGLPRNFGVLAVFVWCAGFTSAGTLAGHIVMKALGFRAALPADGGFIDGFMAAMVATLGIGYVTYRLREPTDPGNFTSDGAHR